MNYFAHTAVRADGKPELDTANWQFLSSHLRNVAELAQRFADPLGLGIEARLAGLTRRRPARARRQTNYGGATPYGLDPNNAERL